MAVTILNPARFTSDPNGSRRMIRTAFFDEGYGVSSSFKAYRQGGGIVPATSAFDIIGAGTSGDPLRMSQFSGFVVPSLALDTQTVTTGGFYDGGGESATGASGYQINNFGSISDGTFNVKAGRTIMALYADFSYGSGSGNLTFQITPLPGTTNDGWTTMTISSGSGGSGGGVFLRQDASFFSTVGATTWYWSTNDMGPFGQGAFVSEVFTVTFT
jgi:hypothetical protein